MVGLNASERRRRESITHPDIVNMAATTQVSCEDITDTLQAMRAIDDKIIYELNVATPTQSFRNEVDPSIHCKSLYDQLNKIYDQRDSMIETCLSESKMKLRSIQLEASHKLDDPRILRRLRTEQSKIRELQNEVTIEEIIRERSLKVFEERCRQYYKPPKPE
ncbi:protein MIX23 isoform X2 [Procambarus clarkii]|uniref:protein MIX23 isoform X2 n=1 Tax=Procambarus clarkii TaxID=6728 RepID=UPI001E6788A5|nr:protein MIX23-like isoform X2 [Procambarus clarkii]